MYISNTIQSTYSSIQKTNNATSGYVVKDTQPTVSSDQNSGGISKYDFSNMTRGEMLSTVNSLIKSGQMSLDESSSLVPMMGPQLSVNGTLTDMQNQKFDFIGALKQSISFNQSIGNTAGIKYDNMALSALEKLQGNPSHINITV